MEPINGIRRVNNTLVPNCNQRQGFRVLRSREELVNYSGAVKVQSFATLPTDFNKKNLIAVTMKVSNDITTFNVFIEVDDNAYKIIFKKNVAEKEPAPLIGNDYSFIEIPKEVRFKIVFEND